MCYILLAAERDQILANKGRSEMRENDKLHAGVFLDEVRLHKRVVFADYITRLGFQRGGRPALTVAFAPSV